MSDAIIPITVLIIVLTGAIKKHNVFAEFLDGATQGLHIIVKIVPSLVLMVVLVTMFKSSGALNVLTYSLRTPCKIFNIPPEIIPLAIMHPLSGGGSLALYKELLLNYGPDSFIGQVASVMQGSAETTFYTIVIYYGATKVRNTRHTLVSSLSADLTSMIVSIITVRLLLV